MDTTAGALLVRALFTLVFAAVLVGWFSRPASKANGGPEALQWAKGHGLQLTPGNGPMVMYYVKLSITVRVIGGVGGLVLGSLFDDAFGLDTSSGAGFWIWIVLGWLLGSSWAEYRLTRPPSSGQVASLTPRDVGDYLSRRMYAAPVVAAALTVVVAFGGLVAPATDAPQGRPPPVIGLVLAGVGSVAISMLVRLAIRSVVARRQPTGPADIVAADDAIRASAVHNLAGGGTAAILLIAAQVVWSTLYPYHLPFGVRAWVPGLLLLAALLAWRFYAYRYWMVRRSDPTAVARP